MADGHRYRSLVETEEYSAQLAAITSKHSFAVIDPIVRGLLWGISKNPSGYGRTTNNIRMAKSRSFGLTVPILKVFFAIEDQGLETEYVLLLWMEESSSIDEMGDYVM